MESRITLTRVEAAEHCNVSLPILDGLLHRKENPLPHIKVGRRYIIPRASLEKWLAEEAALHCDRNGHTVR